MTQLAKIENITLSTMTEQQLMAVLKSSLYPGAKDESIKMVLAYCQAAKLDPMQKPVHIVPMSVKEGGDYVWRDIIMPGIGLYRTQAARSGEYGGITEPEFGEDVISDKDVGITYPKWCKITVKRIVNGNIVDFSAKEYWTENYATKKKDTFKPNAMWERRPYAQLAKCTEAQALRKAFPELGSMPTADEMAGKEYGEIVESSVPEKHVEEKKQLPELTLEQLEKRVLDKVDTDGVVTFGTRSKIQEGTASAEDFIAFLSAKFTLSEEIKSEINSWGAK